MAVGKMAGLTIVCFMLLVTRTSVAQNPLAFAALQDSSARLEPEVKVSGRLLSPVNYPFELQSNEYFSLSIQKSGTDIAVSILDPDGREIRTVPCYQAGPVRISEIANRTGTYSARFRVCGPEVPYDLVLSRPRTAQLQDRQRVAGEHSYADAERSAAQYTASSRRTAIGKYQDSLKNYAASGAVLEQVPALVNLAKLYREIGSWEQASSSVETALRLTRDLPDSAARVQALLALAAVRFGRGDLALAQVPAEEALKIAGSLSNRTEEAESNFLLGKIYYYQSDSNAAVTFEQAKRMFESLGDRDGAARATIYLAGINSDGTGYAEANEAGKQAAAAFKSLGDRQNEGLMITVLGHVQTAHGHPQEALTLFGQATSLVNDSGDLFTEATLLGGLAGAHSDMDNKEAAREFFKRALDKLRALGDQVNVAATLLALGKCTAQTGDTGTALTELREAQSVFHKIPDMRGEAWALGEIGLVYESAREYQKASDTMEQAILKIRMLTERAPLIEAQVLVGIGRLSEHRGDIDQALQNYNEALGVYEDAEDGIDRLTARYHISHALHLKGDDAGALTSLKTAIGEIETLRAGVTNTSLRTSFFASVRQQYDLYIDTLMRVHRDVDAFEASEQSHARTLVDTIAETSMALSDGVNPQLIESKATRLADLDKLTGQLQKLINSSSDPKAIAKLNGEIVSANALLEVLEGQIRNQSPKYAAHVQPGVASLAEVQSELDDSVMLEYALGEDSSYLFALTQKDFKSYRLPGKSDIESRVRLFRELIMTVPSPLAGQRAIAEAKAKYEKAANELGAVLLGPAAGLLGERRLVIVPDGILHALPFGALAIPQTPSSAFAPLALGHDIVNLASASALVTSRRVAPQRNHPGKTIAVFADAVYQRTDGRFSAGNSVSLQPKTSSNTRAGLLASSDAELPRLRYTQNEANAIFSLVSAADRMDATGWKATKAALQSPDLNRFKYIHIAAHSILNDAYPDLSSLVLSRWDSNGKPLDGSVRLRDVYNLKLSAELVVLSACDTGLGKEVRGEGLISMVRAFMSIGTPRVLATLWKVDDEQTSAFMTEFYRQLLDKQRSPAEAVRGAQRALLQKAGTQSPYFWAGFQLHGDWR
jgi:CHAT domain-containing protein